MKTATAVASSCEQWQLTDGKQPCGCRDADTAKFDDREERETNPEVRQNRTPGEES